MSNKDILRDIDPATATVARQTAKLKQAFQPAIDAMSSIESMGVSISKYQQEMAVLTASAVKQMTNIQQALRPNMETMETIESIGKSISKQQQEIAALVTPVAQQITNVQQTLQPVISAMDSIGSFVTTWQEIFRPLHETISLINEQYFLAVTSATAKYCRVFKAIDLLRNNQYVHWIPLTREQINEILESDDIDGVLYGIETADNNTKINATIKDCIDCKLLKTHQRIFEQAITAFRRGDYDISIVSMFSIIDGLLTRYSGNLNTRMKERTEQILKNITIGATLKDEEFSALILSMTFSTTIEKLSESIPFSENEPSNLNRHWIIHGRSNRNFTALDCMKLVNCIYGILLIGILQCTET